MPSQHISDLTDGLQRCSQAFICAGRQIRMKEKKKGGGTGSDDRVWQVQKYGPFYY